MQIQDAISKIISQKGKKVSYEAFGKALGYTKQYVCQSKTKELNDKQLKELEVHFGVDFTKVNNEDCVEIPVRGNLSASLGQGIEIVDETQTGVYSVSRKLMKDVGANPNNTDFIPCEGDSMFPTIESGALLMVDRSKTEVFDGKIYCVRLNGNLIAKRLQFIPPNSIKVISDNKDKYDAFYVDLSKTLEFDFAIIGQVKWYGTIVR